MEIEQSLPFSTFKGPNETVNQQMNVESNSTNKKEKRYQRSSYQINQDPYLPLDMINRYITCGFCNKNITNTLSFQCHECTDFYICKECMVQRRENEHHKSTHGYHVKDNLKAFQPFAEDWSADEELRLTEGLEVFCFGNWEEIAAYVSTKSERHCVDHYSRCYLQTPSLLPNESIRLPNTFVEQEIEEEIPPYKGPGSDINGYSPFRDDYDVEFDNDAELILKDVEILGDEDDREKELKTCLLRGFNERLKERNKRKRFVRERNLLNLRNILNDEKKESKERQDINNRLKPFSRFLTQEKYDELLKGLLTEAKLRERILMLQGYRKNGIRTIEEAERFEREKKKEGEILNANVLDVNRMDGAELLMPEERELCSRMHLVPRHYLSIKSTIIEECCKNGMISAEDATKKITIDVERKEKIYDFFISCGWITTANHIHE